MGPGAKGRWTAQLTQPFSGTMSGVLGEARSVCPVLWRPARSEYWRCGGPCAAAQNDCGRREHKTSFLHRRSTVRTTICQLVSMFNGVKSMLNAFIYAHTLRRPRQPHLRKVFLPSCLTTDLVKT